MKPACPETLVSRALSHPGLVRAENQDAILDDPDAGLWLVADGVGGYDHGGVASQAIVDALQALARDCRGPALAARVPEALGLVHEQLLGYAREAGLEVVGSTVAVLVLEGEHFHVYWAGDSRVYLFRAGRLQRLSEDHVEPAGRPGAGALYRAVGAPGALDLDYIQGTLYCDDVFLLCSDGLNKMVSDAELAAVLRASPPETACERLLQAALGRGAGDNVSCLTVHVRDGSGA